MRPWGDVAMVVSSRIAVCIAEAIGVVEAVLERVRVLILVFCVNTNVGLLLYLTVATATLALETVMCKLDVIAISFKMSRRTLFKHQRDASEQLRLERVILCRCLLFLEKGLGNRWSHSNAENRLGDWGEKQLFRRIRGCWRRERRQDTSWRSAGRPLSGRLG